MIFKFINNDLDGVINKIGVANGSLADMVNAYRYANGATGKFASAFNVTKSGLTEQDIENIKAYNSEIDACTGSQTAFYRTMMSSTDEAKKLVEAANGNKVSMNGLTVATKSGTVSMIGARIAATALQTALSMGLALAIQAVVTGLNYLVHLQENLYESAKEQADASAESAKAHKEEADSLNELINKYKELSEKDISNKDVRSEIVSVQEQIIDLVGSEVDELDLVNGKLSKQLSILQEIQKTKNNDVVASLEKAYIDSKKEYESYNIEEFWSIWDFQPNTFDVGGYNQKLSYDEAVKAAEIINKVLKDNGWGNAHADAAGDGNSGSTVKVTLNESSRAKQEEIFVAMRDELMKKENNYDYNNSPVWNRLQTLYEELYKENEGLVNKAQSHAENLVLGLAQNNILTTNQSVASLSDYINLRDNIIKNITNNSTIIEALNDGNINHDQIEQFVNNQLGSVQEYEKYYNQWVEKQKSLDIENGINEIKKAYSDKIKSKNIPSLIDLSKSLTDNAKEFLNIDNVLGKSTKSSTEQKELSEFNNWIDNLSDKEKEAVYNIACNTDTADYTLEQWKKEVESEKIEIEVETFVENISSIETLSKGLDLIDEVYSDIKNSGEFDYSKIFNNESFNDQFSDLSYYNEFIKTISSSPDDINKCQDAFDTLVTEYIQSKAVLKDLTEEEKDVATAMLKQMGVANASEVVNARLALEKEKLANNTSKVANATLIETYELFKEAEAGSLTQQALAELAIEKIDLENNKIDTSDEVTALIDMASAANASTESLIKLQEAQKYLIKAEAAYAKFSQLPEHLKGFYTEGGDYLEYERNLAKAKEILDDVNNGTFNYNFEIGAKVNYTGGAVTNDLGSSSDSSNTSEKEPQIFDWIEKAISKIEKKISNLSSTVSNIFKNWTNRNKALKSSLSEISKEIDIQNQAYDRYMKEANSVGLSDKWKKKVQNGTIDIESVEDEGLAEKIEKYSEWYNKALDCKDAVSELNDTLAESYQTSFDNVIAQYDGILKSISHEKNLLDESITQSEAKGYITSTKYYEALIKNEKENNAKLIEERDELVSSFNKMKLSGTIEEGSEAWNEMQHSIDDVTLSIKESDTALIEYGNSIRDIEWQVFDLIQDSISQINQETDFLIDLVDNSKLFDDKGQFTKEGTSVLGLHSANYNVYMGQANKYAQELLNINKQLEKDPNNQTLIERKQELLQLQQDSIIAAEGEKQAIVDLVEEGINIELDALQELIDKYNDALDSAKDLYDYENSISEKTSNISNLQKQLSAYAGDTSEEIKSKIQKLQVELADAEKDLEETQYDKYISNQKELLDDLYNDYELELNKRLDNVDGLIKDVVDGVNSNSAKISHTIETTAKNVGYTMTDAMKAIWAIGSGDVVTTYVRGVQSETTTISNTLKAIDNKIGRLLNGYDVDVFVGSNSSSLKEYATGKHGFTEDEIAWTQDGGREFIVRPSDGAILTPIARDDSVLSTESSDNIWNMANNPHDFIRDNLVSKDVGTPINHNNHNSYTQHLDKVIFNLPNVKNYSELLSEMQRDKNFERLILSMTVDQLAGKSSLGVGRAIRK